MPLGATPFGYGPFGETVEAASVTYEPLPPPPAILFDPYVRDAVLDADGRFEEMDVVDQQVVLSFAIPRGSVKHAPEVGHDFMTLPRVFGKALEDEVKRRAALASPFDRLVKAGEVNIVAVTLQNPKKTESRIAISYRKRGETQTRSATVGTK